MSLNVLDTTKVTKERLSLIKKENTTKGKKMHGAPKGIFPPERHAYLKLDATHLMLPKLYINKFTLLTDLPKIHYEIPDEDLFDYQRVVISYLVEYMKTIPIAYIKMGTGLGKSRLSLALALKLQHRFIVVAPTRAISEQILDEAIELCPNIKTILYGNHLKINKDDYDMLVVIINTFRDKDDDFLEGFGTIIFDEAHELHSKENSKALFVANSKKINYVIGLSATPLERDDGMDKFVTKFLGNPIDVEKLPNFNVSVSSFKAKVKIIKYSGHPECAINVLSEAGTTSAIMTIQNIIRDPHRMELIVNEVSRLAAEGHGVMLFSETRDYLIELRTVLLSRFSNEEIDAPELENISVLRGDSSARRAKAACTRAKDLGAHIVLTTYGYSRRGISLKEMTSLVLATPRRSGSTQILGRIFRKGSDESIIREIVDIVDVCTSLKSQITTRQEVYEARKYPIEIFDVDYTNLSVYTPQTTVIDDDTSKTKEELLNELYG